MFIGYFETVDNEWRRSRIYIGFQYLNIIMQLHWWLGDYAIISVFTFKEVLTCSHMRDNAWKLIKCYKQEQAGPMSRPGIIFISYLLIWPTSRPCLINSSTHRIVRPPANRPARNCRHCASIYLRSVSKLRAIGSTTNNLPIHLGGVSSADTLSLTLIECTYSLPSCQRKHWRRD